MHIRRIAFWFLLVLPAGTLLLAEPPSLRDAVGEEIYRKTGLDKLTPEEQQLLVGELSRIIEDGENPFFDPANKEKRFGLGSLFQQRAEKSLADEPDEVRTRIIGEFDGWTGRTRFKLENGQVWVQSENDTFSTRKMTNPGVVLEKGMLGAYFLSVEGFGSRVKVKRLK